MAARVIKSGSNKCESEQRLCFENLMRLFRLFDSAIMSFCCSELSVLNQDVIELRGPTIKRGQI